MRYRPDFRPKILDTFKGYNRKRFATDLTAGIVVGIVALPLAIAFGIASGVSPEQGIITAIIGGFIVSAFGGSSVQIGGPTGAFIVIVSGIIATYGIEGLMIATVMAGVMLAVMGLLKLGIVIKFIPYPIVVGFTGGIALTIFTTQIGDFFGLTFDKALPDGFLSKWQLYFESIGTINWWALLIGVISILIIVFTPRISRRLPGSLIAIVVVTGATYAMRHWLGIEGIETIGDRFTINPSLPSPQGFNLDMETITRLLPPAFTIAMLGAIESLLSATVADGVTGDKHNSNTELVAQGAANIVVPFFGGIPVTGAIARTMTNINNGGRSPISGIVHAVVLLLILLFLSPLAKHIPMACLAGILIVVAYNMSEWRTIKAQMRNPRSDAIVLIVTLSLTVLFDLTIAIMVGLVMAVALFMRRIMENTNISVIEGQLDMKGDSERDDVNHIHLEKGVEVYEIDGPFFFGIASKFDEQMRTLGDKSKVRIIRMRKVPFIDATGIHNLTNLVKASTKEHIAVILSGVSPSVHETLTKSGFNNLVGEDNICANIHIAAERANALVGNISN